MNRRSNSNSVTPESTPLAKRSLALLGSLYIAQAIPLGFFIVALPAIARSEGLSLERVGLLGTLAFPYLLKFLWAPLVDRHGSSKHGHYRSWIVPLSIGSVTSVLALAIFEPARAFATDSSGVLIAGVIVLTALFMLCSATQDAATDGLAVRLVRPDQRGTANGIQVGGYYLGQVLGGGLMLVLFGQLGWTGALLIMALILALPLLPLRGFREPATNHEGQGLSSGFSSLAIFFRRPGVLLWVAVLVTFRAGETMALAMLNPMLIDQGYSLESVGLAVGLAGSLASMVGAVAGGAITQRLGHRRSIILLGFVQTAAIMLYVIPASTGSWTSVLVAVVVASAAGGAATAALYTWMMDRCAPHSAASDFTVQQSLCALGPLLAVGLSGVSASSLGYANHFVLSAGLALTATMMVALFVGARHAAVAAPRDASAS